MSRIKTLHDYVLVKEYEKKKSSLIVLPETKETPEVGTVVGIGPDVKGIKVGNVVVFKKWASQEVTIEEERLFFLKAEDVYAVITHISE